MGDVTPVETRFCEEGKKGGRGEEDRIRKEGRKEGRNTHTHTHTFRKGLSVSRAPVALVHQH